MDRLSFKLAVVLGLQLVLALVLWSGGPDYSAYKAKEPLLAFDAAKIDRIEIAETGAGTAVLAKVDGKWVIPASAGFPADEGKVGALLGRLAGLKKGWPVASSGEAAKRFKVAPDLFERKVVLKSGSSTVAELLLGTAPSFKQVTARTAGDGHVYSVAFAAYEASAKPEEWMNRALLNIPQDQIASISIGDIALDRKDGKFVLAGLEKDQKQDETATYRLIGALTYPVFDAVAGKGPEALAKLKDGAMEVTLKLVKGDPIVLKYKKEEGGGAYLFTSSANGFLFRASEASAAPIVQAKREVLIQAPPKKEEPKKPEQAGAGAVAAPQAVKPGEGGDAATLPVAPEGGAQEAAPAAAARPDEPEKGVAGQGAEAVQPAEAKTGEGEAEQGAAGAAQPAETKSGEGQAGGQGN